MRRRNLIFINNTFQSGTEDPFTNPLPFQISIPEDKESSARAAENATEDIQVFTDGSAQEGKVGAAAILIKNRSSRILHVHLGPEAEHTVHEAELVGLLLAIHLISTEKRAATTCSIAMDHQAVIRAFDSDLRRPGHHLAREFLKIANRVQQRKNMIRGTEQSDGRQAIM